MLPKADESQQRDADFHQITADFLHGAVPFTGLTPLYRQAVVEVPEQTREFDIQKKHQCQQSHGEQEP